jgi:hypothetical protein
MGRNEADDSLLALPPHRNNRRMVLLHYGEKWRNMRRFLHAHLHDKMGMSKPGGSMWTFRAFANLTDPSPVRSCDVRTRSGPRVQGIDA